MSITEQTTAPSVVYKALDQKFTKIFGESALTYAEAQNKKGDSSSAETEAQKQKLDQLKQLLEKEKPNIKPLIESATVSDVQPLAITNSNVVSVQGYWWGFHVAIPEGPLNTVLNSPITDLTATIGGLAGIAAAGAACTWAPLIPVLVVVFGAESLAIRAINQGNGVYLSWTWIQIPLIVVPGAAQPVITAI